jgi:hypothetical protein
MRTIRCVLAVSSFILVTFFERVANADTVEAQGAVTPSALPKVSACSCQPNQPSVTAAFGCGGTRLAVVTTPRARRSLNAGLLIGGRRDDRRASST